MQADRDIFIDRIRRTDRDTLLSLAVSLYDELAALKLLQRENERISTEAHIQFSELDRKYAAAVRENKELKELLSKEIEKNTLKTKSIFGRKTEKLFSMLDALDNPQEEPVDENAAEDTVPQPAGERKQRVVSFEDHKSRQDTGGRHGKRNPGLADSLKGLPEQIIYDLDVEGLNGQYGENNWRIVYWHHHKKLMKLDTPYYTQVVYTPVVSVGLEHDLFTHPYRNPLLDKSAVSCTIMADILYRKFVLGLPFYRQAADYCMQGISLGRQTIIHWVNTLVPEVCEEIYPNLPKLLYIGFKLIPQIPYKIGV